MLNEQNTFKPDSLFFAAAAAFSFLLKICSYSPDVHRSISNLSGIKYADLLFVVGSHGES